MSIRKVEFLTSRSEAEQNRLRELVDAHDGMKAVSEWCAAQEPAIRVETVTQDEFTHDLIVALNEDTFLVYDTT